MFDLIFVLFESLFRVILSVPRSAFIGFFYPFFYGEWSCDFEAFMKGFWTFWFQEWILYLRMAFEMWRRPFFGFQSCIVFSFNPIIPLKICLLTYFSVSNVMVSFFLFFHFYKTKPFGILSFWCWCFKNRLFWKNSINLLLIWLEKKKKKSHFSLYRTSDNFWFPLKYFFHCTFTQISKCTKKFVLNNLT